MILVSGDAFATGIGSWDSATDDKDKSIEFLGLLFGTVGTALSGPDSGILGAVMQIFNIAVLTLGSIVVSYTIIVSTINTAQEGEVMGRKWSSAWIPLRAAMGAALLIPAPTYSLIQIIFMHITIMGVQAANQIWTVALTTMSTTGLEGSIKVGTDSELQGAVQHLFKGLVCAAIWNEGSFKGKLGEGLVVKPYKKYPEGELWIGVEEVPYYHNICGGLKAGSPPSQALSNLSWTTTNLDAFMNAASILQPAAEEAVLAEPSTWGSNNAITSAMNAIKNSLAMTPIDAGSGSGSGDDTDFGVDVELASQHGWLYAGSYYFAFTGASSVDATYNAPSTVSPNADDINHLDTEGKTVYQPNAQLLANQYILSTTPDPGGSGSGSGGGPEDSGSSSNAADKLNLSPPANLTGEAMQFLNAILGPLRDVAYSFMDRLTARYDDPLTSIRAMGTEIMFACEVIWFAIITTAFLILIVGCILSSVSPVCWALGAILMILIPILSIMLALFWAIGCVMGIYIPMIPYLVYTFTAIGWLVLVIETIIAAPIVALGLVSPAQEVLGKAAPAVMLITGVFLRPSLMVIGFIGAALLLRTVMTMINFGFSATTEASLAGIGLFGIIALITLYGGLALAIVHECFSLIYVLPDKVLRWIGGQVEQSQVAQQVRELEKSVDKGSQIGSSLMKGSASMAGKAGDKAMSGASPGLSQITNIIQQIISAGSDKTSF